MLLMPGRGISMSRSLRIACMGLDGPSKTDVRSVIAQVLKSTGCVIEKSCILRQVAQKRHQAVVVGERSCFISRSVLG